MAVKNRINEMGNDQRSSKITGDFGRIAVMHWLSKHGYHVAKVDFTGIDLIAYNRKTKERLGIVVKTCSYPCGKSGISVALPARKDVFDACAAFACMPYIVLIVDTAQKHNKVKFYLLPWSEMANIRIKGEKKCWLIKNKFIEQNKTNPKIKKIVFSFGQE